MAFSLPQDRVFSVSRVSVRLDPAPHPFETANAAAIAAHWKEAVAANPTLFNGQVALLSDLALRDGALAGRCHIVRYSTFLYWRSVRPIGGAGHVYAHAMLVGADGALLAVRMAPHTVNAGMVYFAAGSFEPEDFRDGEADLDFNIHREVREETGLDITGLRRERDYHLVSKRTGTALFRRYVLDEPAEAAAERIRAHVAGESEPEIVGPVVIRDGEALPPRLAEQMPDLIAWHFANPLRV